MMVGNRPSVLGLIKNLTTICPYWRKTPNRGYTTVERLLIESIKATGPLQVPRYLQMCLSHPTHGYYMRQDVFGTRGDFTTSPEISQIFGELVAAWFLIPWMKGDKGKTETIRLVELGPGRGTLISDIIRVFSSIPFISDALGSVHLVESSLKLRELQNEKLLSVLEGSRVAPELHWHNRIEDVPPSDAYTMIVANEFFDALPFHIIHKTPEGFREVLIGLKNDQSSLSSESRLDFFLSDTISTSANLLSTSSPRFSRVPDGTRIEISPTSWTVARKIGELIRKKGAGLIIDYGAEHFFGASFRAFRNHRIVHVFDQPGHSDLTSNVDFAYLKEALSPIAQSLGPMTQRDFLHRMHFNARLQGLVSQAPAKRVAEVQSAGHRLVDPSGMGTQYKIMGVIPQRAEVDSQSDLPLYPFKLSSTTQSD